MCICMHYNTCIVCWHVLYVSWQNFPAQGWGVEYWCTGTSLRSSLPFWGTLLTGLSTAESRCTVIPRRKEPTNYCLCHYNVPPFLILLFLLFFLLLILLSFFSSLLFSSLLFSSLLFSSLLFSSLWNFSFFLPLLLPSPPSCSPPSCCTHYSTTWKITPHTTFSPSWLDCTRLARMMKALCLSRWGQQFNILCFEIIHCEWFMQVKFKY